MNGVNLSTPRAVMAALMHIPNLDYRYANVGAMAALRSPQSAELIANINPENAARAGKGYSNVRKDGTYHHRVLYNYAPKKSGGGSTTRQKLSAGSLSGSTNPTNGSQAEFLIDQYREFVVEGTVLTSDVMKEPKTIEYINGVISGKVSVDGVQNPSSAAQQAMGMFGLEIARRADNDMFQPINTVLITDLVAAIGKNAAFPTASDPSTAAPIVEVNGFENDGLTPHADTYHAIRETKLMNKFQGRPIVLGGKKAEKYFATRAIVGLKDSGFELGNIIGQTDVEFYYDETIDTVWDESHFFVIEPNSAAAIAISEHNNVFGIVKELTHATMKFGYGNLAISQVQGANSVVPPTLQMPIDFRILEDIDATDYPINAVALGMKYGVYTRPTSFLTTVSGDILKDITGVYAFKMKNNS